MKISPEDKAELDAVLARSDYIVEHHRQKFKEEADKLGREINSATAFALGFLTGSAIILATWLWVSFLFS